jgi:hypothetical protein
LAMLNYRSIADIWNTAYKTQQEERQLCICVSCWKSSDCGRMALAGMFAFEKSRPKPNT